jgi:hypothetical protein
MILEILLKKTLGAVFALQSHTVVHYLFVLFESLDIVLKATLLVLHLHNLLRQVVVHRKKLLVLGLELLLVALESLKKAVMHLLLRV